MKGFYIIFRTLKIEKEWKMQISVLTPLYVKNI